MAPPVYSVSIYQGIVDGGSPIVITAPPDYLLILRDIDARIQSSVTGAGDLVFTIGGFDFWIVAYPGQCTQTIGWRGRQVILPSQTITITANTTDLAAATLCLSGYKLSLP